MRLEAGTKLGRYELRSLLGVGGMGEVYRAFDPKIGRDVAIKVLPADFSADKDRVARFEQEARAAGALNHPNILAVYDIDSGDGNLFVVSELLEGEELRDRLGDGTLPLRKVIDYALQIVAGLSAAHGKGIVHRDLKPENIFVTSDERVKILDFGLAKVNPLASADFGLRNQEQETLLQPEIQNPKSKIQNLTAPGVVMGTVGYMSPEQVRGVSVDHRSDIFSFGVILYEMIAGRRAFQHETMAETMSAILKEEPPEMTESNRNINPALERIIRRCLEKRPERRFQTASDLGFALEALSAPSVSSGNSLTSVVSALDERSAKRGVLPWFVAGALAIALFSLGAIYYLNRAVTETRATRLSFTVPPELSFNDVASDWAVISPDGRKIAFSATADGRNMLYVRELDSSQAKLLPGSDNPVEPFWSPDSKSVAYGSNGKLKRSELSGGSAQVICDAARIVGGSWSKDGTIIFVPDYRTRLVQVSEKGGEPTPVALNLPENEEPRHRYPFFLPDGRRFLFLRESKGLWAGSLDSPEIMQIMPTDSMVVYSKDGFLVFIRNKSLVAQRFDAGSLKLSGEVISLDDDQKLWTNTVRFSVSDNGTLLWQTTWEREYQLIWFDRTGKQVGTVEAPAKIAIGMDPRLSPDGKRVAIKRNPPQTIWVVDIEKGNSVRVTSDFGQMPLWSPDGSRIAYAGNPGLVTKASSGLGDPEVVLSSVTSGAVFTSSWSPDGRYIIYTKRGVKTRLDLYAVLLEGERKEIPLLNSPFDERSPALSPDGKWLAYDADDTGSTEIYVQRFLPDGNGAPDRKLVSTKGGRMAVWSRDGKELFFISADGQLMSAEVKASGDAIEFTEPKVLFQTRMLAAFGSVHEFDVSPDGQRFLIGTLVGESKVPSPTVILNWSADLKK